MKTYIPIILMLILGCKSIKTTNDNVQNSNNYIPKYQKLSTFKGNANDTLTYVRTSIIGRKNKYIGKELNVLLNDLELPVRTYLIGLSNKKGLSPSLTLEFYPRNVMEIKRQNKIDPVILVIEWEKPLPLSIADSLMVKNKAIWTKEEKEYFGKQKVKDIVLTDYKFQ
jgi:hypothetical protein